MKPAERTSESQSLCMLILDRLTPDIRTVCAYSALPDEADLRLALEGMLQRGIHLYLPRITHGHMAFYQIHALTQLQPGMHGILEPPADTPILEDGTADIVLVPGRAFDQAGNRLGRGKGHYDRWIALQRSLNAKTQFWGIAFLRQTIGQIPAEEHDQQMDAVLVSLAH